MPHEIASPLHQGKVKSLYETGEPDELLMIFDDKVTAGNGEKEDYPQGKGALCCDISTFLFRNMEHNEIRTHFIRSPGHGAMVVKNLDMIPIEVICRNIAAGSILKHTGVEEGTKIEPPAIEPHLKDDSLNDPLLTWDRVRMMGINAQPIVRNTIIINKILTEIFSRCGIDLVDFKLEFGLDADNQVYIADELSPDNMRLWQKGSKENYDKDLFRKGNGDIMEGYKYILKSLSQLQTSNEPTD